MTSSQSAALNALGEHLRRHPSKPVEVPIVQPLTGDDLHLRKACDSHRTEEDLEEDCNRDRRAARLIAIRAQAMVLGAATEIGLSATDREYLAGFFTDMADELDTAVIDYHGMERP